MTAPERPSETRADATPVSDDDDLTTLGYRPQLRRTMSSFTAFALAFSMVSINTGIITLFTDPYQFLGGSAVFLWLPVLLLVLTLVAVYAHLAGRMPITGYAYQWSSRLVGPNFGWFTGWIALISFLAGTAGTAAAVGTVFAPEIWTDPTPRQIQLLSIGCTVVAAVLNIIGVKVATRINNIGASIELIGTVVLGIVLIAGLLTFFGHTEGPAILTDTKPLSGSAVTLTGVSLAALLPVYVLLGWEGAADLAEETLDPRRAAPRAMFRAVIVSGLIGFVIFALLGMALPEDPAGFFASPENPVLRLLAVHLGPFARALMIVVAFASIFACLIANMAVATRMTFALSRDNMLPASRGLQKVTSRSRAPARAIIFVAAVAIGLNLLNDGLVGQIYAMVGLTYYLVYGLTLIATAIASRRGRIPAARPGVFDLGRWLNPIVVLGLLWCAAVVTALTVPEDNRQNAITAAVVLGVGFLWWVLVLRRRLKNGEAGPPTARPTAHDTQPTPE
ncbi:APC family permease [Amycolatopsis jiangsuensis]|uniref:Amino acid transporter n=1 Tax=Amycolatopsis jiangsuensis TaxID=1181879 RepID=A0A840IQ30_9PSEU|nr:amino acid permease [Amycolatopsis jiangsuensis]MBB4683487.1 amino acid transporter [Amycolatopsis jiangsuensis]